ncbi:MAG: hypothetical protein FJ115_04745 [Deltaproteobacteria bacterium]|nr:hypothetical protein [Deltaproteobacteria bacterium]MBM4322851.1 hypothetical protein [Deltaproteobacteria bacterium]
MEIKVVEIKLVHGDKPLKALVAIEVGGIIIRDIRVVKENGRRPVVLAPQNSWKGDDGQIRYRTVVTFPDEVKGEIDFVVLKRYIGELEKCNADSTR